jgi:DNA polymerase-4
VDVLQRVFGKSGKEMWKKANGIDPSPVTSFHERKSISTERTFDRDTIDLHKLNDLLVAMTENLAYQLRRGNKLTACVAVKIRYADFNTHSLQRHIPYTSADHQLLPVVRELFQKLYHRRVRIRLIGIRLSHLVGGGHQMNLFEDSEELIQLYQAMDRVRKRYGDRAILRASGMEARTIGRITNPFSGSAPELLANRRT